MVYHRGSAVRSTGDEMPTEYGMPEPSALDPNSIQSATVPATTFRFGIREAAAIGFLNGLVILYKHTHLRK